MTRYTIGPGGYPEWQTRDAIEIGVSLLNPAHEGDKLFSILYWAAKRFDHCIITLSDTLFRHNLMAGGLSEAEAWVRTRKMGDQWLEANWPVIRSAGLPQCTIRRWDEWLSHPEFEHLHRKICNLYRSDAAFAAELDLDVADYARRRRRSDTAASDDEIAAYCRAYLLEELACYILIARTWKALRAYPSTDLRCFQYLRRNDVPEDLRGLDLAPHLVLNFKKKLSTSRMAA